MIGPETATHVRSPGLRPAPGSQPTTALSAAGIAEHMIDEDLERPGLQEGKRGAQQHGGENADPAAAMGGGIPEESQIYAHACAEALSGQRGSRWK
jgi:hypothetical protein